MKISRFNIPRGVKLVKQMVFTPVEAIRSMLANLGVDKENLAKNRVPWHVSLNFPVISSRFFGANDEHPGSPLVELCAPFIAFPPQDQFSATARQTTQTVKLTLDSLVISFDQRAERGGIHDTFRDPLMPYSGSVTSECARGYDINLRISEKTPVAFGAVAPFLSERDIWSGHYSQIAAVASDGAFNPFIWGNLNLQLDPYKTYIVRISCPTLNTYNACFCSFNVTLNCFSTLMVHDQGAGFQNMPTATLLEPTHDYVPVKVPSGNDPIDCGPATLTDGTLDDPLVRFDQMLQQRLRGGIGDDSSLPVTSHTEDDAGYEMIAVPMFQNVGLTRRLVSQYWEQFPMLDTGMLPFNTVIDRRIVPLPFPFVIHHVVAVVSYAAPPSQSPLANAIPQNNSGRKPSSASLLNKVGVALGTGLRGDLFAYQQVANVQWHASDAPTIDKFKQTKGGILTGTGSFPPDQTIDWDYEIRSVPIVGSGGHGVVNQGKPFYAGRASSLYTARTDAGQLHSAPTEPKTKGCEQFLQIDWDITDPGGLAGPGDGGAAPTEFDTYAGEGGHWVLILGKKMLVGGRNDLGV